MFEEKPIVENPSAKVGKIKIMIASPERIRQWSKGEVTKPETINYRTFKPEKDGLFCERIFGPVKDYECSCGKYKGKKYEGTVCERCGVKVQPSSVRRQNMGHIELASPVTHIWHMESEPHPISRLLGIKLEDLENVVYFGSSRVLERAYIVVDKKDTNFSNGDLLYETEYRIYKDRFTFDVEQALKVRNSKGPVVSEVEGIAFITEEKLVTERLITNIEIVDADEKCYELKPGHVLRINDGQQVKKGQLLAEGTRFNPIFAPEEGKIKIDEINGKIRILKNASDIIKLPSGMKFNVTTDQYVEEGDLLAAGEREDIIAPFDGEVRIENDLLILSREYVEQVELNSMFLVKEGERIRKGEKIAYITVEPLYAWTNGKVTVDAKNRTIKIGNRIENIPYGSRALVSNNQKVKKGDKLTTKFTKNIVSPVDGIVKTTSSTGKIIICTDEYKVKIDGGELKVKDGEKVVRGDILLVREFEPILAPHSGVAVLIDDELIISRESVPAIDIPYGASVIVKDGEIAAKGQKLTSASEISSIYADTSGRVKLDKNASINVLDNDEKRISAPSKLYLYHEKAKVVYPIFEGGTIYVNDGDHVKAGDRLADKFLFEGEYLARSEYEKFLKVYNNKFEVEEREENSRPILMITNIYSDIAKEINKKVGDLIMENEYEVYRMIYGKKIEAKAGAEAIKELLQKLDLKKLAEDLKNEMKNASSAKTRALMKRLNVVKKFLGSENKPEWMVMDVIPVMPPDLRPMIEIDGGRFATTDLNDLYRRVINRNNRLRKLIGLSAPNIIIRNEKRMLQESVDSLINNENDYTYSTTGRHHRKCLKDKSGRALKSLTDMVKGKKGKFRRDLLGKRVDYSGRAVIIVGPKLKFHECGLPKDMAMELFKPMVQYKLDERGITNRHAKKEAIEHEIPEAWQVLEEVVRDYPVLLNRAPTLHRLSIQAFIPKLIEGDAIQIHPLVCPPFNADFDGDQMAVHVPLSQSAQAEARHLMLSRNNILSPADGRPRSLPTEDIIIGIYYLTVSPNADEKPKFTFVDAEEALLAREFGYITIHTPIRMRIDGDLIETTLGRVIFNMRLPKEMRDFHKTFGKKGIRELVFDIYKRYGIDATADVLDSIKELGFKYATLSGLTISITDAKISPLKRELIKKARTKIKELERHYERGRLTNKERYRKVIEIWGKVTNQVRDVTYDELKKDPIQSLFMMVNSGARGNIDQVKQLGGMRGLMSDPTGRIIELPITSNFREGLSVLEFFISTHGARKGRVDTALRTSHSGYLTRKLVDVAQDIIITEYDCGSKEGIVVNSLRDEGEIIESLESRIFARILAKPIFDPLNKAIIYEEGTMIDADMASTIGNLQELVPVEREERKFNLEKDSIPYDYTELTESIMDNEGKVIAEEGSVLTAALMEMLKKNGIKEAKIKEYPVVGTISVEKVKSLKDNVTIVATIDEEITPTLAKRLTSHNLTSILVRPKVVVRSPLTCKAKQGLCAKCYGMDLSNHKLVHQGEAVGIIAAQSIGEPGTQLTLRTFHMGGIASSGDITQGLPRVKSLFEPSVQSVKSASLLFTPFFRSKGTIKDVGRTDKEGHRRIVVELDNGEEEIYVVKMKNRPRIKVGDRVLPGMPIMNSDIWPAKLMEVVGIESIEHYLIGEIQKVYKQHGVNIHDKHIEIIVRQMLSKVRILNSGDTDFVVGNLEDLLEVEKKNSEILMANAKVEENRQKILGMKLSKDVIIGKDEILGAEGDEVTEEMLMDLVEHGVKDVLVYDSNGEQLIQINMKEPAKYKREILSIINASLQRKGFLSRASFQQTTQMLTDAAIAGTEDILIGLKENVISGQPIPAGTGFRKYESATPSVKGMNVELNVVDMDEKGIG
ncbi:MAG: DNA-directed RNA polymerase subunit beta' [Thermotogae bacterium]|nr:DNA-directed RNA polymerase subunit beta' [Thermotogota bacterium]